MSVNELRSYTYVAKYARHNRAAKRRETWVEAVDRMKEMHLRKYPQAREEIEWAFRYVYEQKVLGSQRALQFGGDPAERHNCRIFNCLASYCDRLRFFQEAFYALLCGGGTGFSVQHHHVAKLPDFSDARRTDTVLPRKTYVIPDSIEGWSDAIGVLLSSYFATQVFPEYADCTVEFDYSQIREAGSVISSGVGKAPGPEPLRKAIEQVRHLLNRCLVDGQGRLRPIDAYDIVMHVSDAVLSGGVRRSATICVFGIDDDEMMTAKTGDWFYRNPQRARSNNSVLLLRDKVTKEQFLALLDKVRQFGEPGFLWADSTEYLVNPCVEVGFWPVDRVTLRSGWQMCNLTTINGREIRDRRDFIYASIAASIIGTLQAGYTDFPYLGEVTERIVRQEALLGVSITGMMDSPEILFNPEFQKMAAEAVVHTNKEIASLLGIQPAARATCLKPEGTTSCLLGTASGCHLYHARRFFRRVQANRMEMPFRLFAEVNPAAVEESVWSANKTDAVMTFCCEIPDGAKTRADMSAIAFLEHVKLTRQNWIHYGRDVSLCTQPWLTNNVSNTINIHHDEWNEVGNYIYDNREHFAGISLLSDTGDLDYPQAPFCEIHDEEQIECLYGSAANATEARTLVNNVKTVFRDLWPACDAAAGVRECDGPGQQAWVDGLIRLADEHMGGDVKKAGYLLKELHLWSEWNHLKEEYSTVDYESMVEEEDATKPIHEISCAGGACSLVF